MLITILSHPVAVDPETRTLRPVDDQGDAFFGLEPGTNGTAAECRRELVSPYRGANWSTSSGRVATSLYYRVP